MDTNKSFDIFNCYTLNALCYIRNII